MVTLCVQALSDGKQPPIVVKVQMSDEAYLRYDPDSRSQLVEQEAKQTLVAAHRKIWASPQGPLIKATKIWPILSPTPELARQTIRPFQTYLLGSKSLRPLFLPLNRLLRP